MPVGDPITTAIDPADPKLAVKYWGVTGSFSDPWHPETTRDWLVRVLLALRERGILAKLLDSSASPASMTGLLEANLDPALLAGPRRQTTCIEIRTPTALLLVDAGSGLQDYRLHSSVATWPEIPAECHLLFTHGHWDHLLGLPFYPGFFTADPQFTVWGADRVLELLRMMFARESTLGETLIPTNFEHLRALGELRCVKQNATYQITDLRVSTLELNHPAGSLAYRFEHRGRTIVIATDHEQDTSPAPASLIEFARGADLLYLDAQYTQNEYQGRIGISGEAPRSRRGWGHSTVETAVALGIAAGVRQLHLGHHDPRRTESELELLEMLAQAHGAELIKAQNRNPEDCRVSLARAGETFLF